LFWSVKTGNGSVYSAYYVSDYSLLKGTHLSGSFPASLQTVDSDYLILQSVASKTATSNHPSGYALAGLTSWVSGSLSQLTSDDSGYMTFRSYYSDTSMADFVDSDTSNVDSSAGKGTHSSFSVQQAGPDSIFDRLTEENTGGASNMTLIDVESFEGTWPPAGWTETGAWNKENSQAYDGGFSADFDGDFGDPSGSLTTTDLNCSDADAIYVDFWYRDDDCDNGDFLLQYYNGSSWNQISDLGSTAQEDQWLHYQERMTNSEYFVSTFEVQWRADTVSIGEHIWVDLVTMKKEVQGNDNYELDLEVQWTNVDYDETNEELAIYVDKGNNTHSLDATGGYMIIGDGTPDWGSTTGTISFWIKWDTVDNRPWGQHDNMETRFSGSKLVIDWGTAASITSNRDFTIGKWYFTAVVWDENADDLYLYVGDQANPPALDTYNNAWTSTVSTVGAIENDFMASRNGVDPTDGHGEDLRYWNTNRTLADIQDDYDTELTGSENNLRSYFKLDNSFDDIGPDDNNGSGSGSTAFSSDVPFDAPPTENIRVDAWNGSAWQNLFTDLSSGWNNISVSSYLESSTFTIRFKDDVEAGDSTRDSWDVDVTLLHVGSDEYAMEVEFTGSSNTEDWSQLNWTVNSTWTAGSVNVTVQLYNHTLGGYPTSGDGYMVYTSGDTPDIDEKEGQTMNLNVAHFRNATGDWKMRIAGVKRTETPFEFKADWIEFKPYHSEYTVSTEFLFSDMTTNTATELNVTVVTQFSIEHVSVTTQFWNYSSSAYATSGESCLEHTSNGANDTITLSIGSNPQFYVSDGNARMKIRSASTTSYQQEINQIELLYSRLAMTPTASFSFQPANPVNNEFMIFNASASYDEDGIIVSYKWDFGDGNITTVSVPTLTHVYAASGAFTVNLTITDDDRLTDNKVESLTVQQYSTAIGQLFDWVTVLLYALLVLFGLLLLFVLRHKRKKKNETKKTEKNKVSLRKKTAPKKTRKTRKSKPSLERKTHPFSRSFGMTHQQMIGKRILLEIDPTANYQKAVFDFVSEANNSGEKLFIFTSANSILHSKFSGSEDIDFFLLTSKASSIRQISKKETLLPASDLSVLLNAFIEIQDVKMKRTKNIVFDNLSDTILLCGFERTYKFIRWALEATSSPKATTLFIFNPTAHNLTTFSSIRGLFQSRFAYAKSGPKAGTL
jgi:hypothetical protein